MLNNIRAIYFDLDNTLIDRNAAFVSCVLDLYESSSTMQIDLLQVLKKDEFGYTSRKEFCLWLIKEYPLKDFTAQGVFDYFIQHIWTYVSPAKTDLLGLLASLSERYKIGILTNGSLKNQMSKINAAELDTIFSKEQIYISQAYQMAKPNKALFQIILNDLKLDPNQVLYVGDNPIDDIFGAKQLGIQTCWISQGRQWLEDFEPNFQLHHILELTQKMTK